MNQITHKFNLIALTILFVTLAFETTAIAQARSFFGKAPSAKLNLTEEAGPWLIMCAAFDGEDGRQQAINLAADLRKNHRLAAYVYRQHFDFASDIANRGMGFQKPTSPGKANLRERKMQLLNQNEKTEYAVLVGDYKSLDSSRAQRDLAKVKKLQPESLEIHSSDIHDTARPGDRMRADSEAMFNSGGDLRRITTSAARSEFPLRLALLVTNPMIPEEILAQAGIDQNILRDNQSLKYTLLDNPKAYTLKIASFSGEVIIRPEDIAEREANKNWFKNSKDDSSLVKAAKRATILTEYLRSKNVEAYIFHDRFSSYVCVGGFDWVREGEGPQARSNPEVTALAKQFTARPVGGGQVTTYPLPARLLEAGVTCDSNPLTVAVPRAKAQGRRASVRSRLR